MASWEEQPLPRSFDSVFYGAAGGGEDLPSDDEFNRVSFLSHFEGANNGVNNAFDDGSADNRTITTAGNMAQGSFGPFARPDGEWGVSFDGSGDSVTTPENSATRIAASNFTFEAFIFPTAGDSNEDTIFTQGADGVYSPFNVFVKSNKITLYISTNGTSWNIASNQSSSNSVGVNSWTHVALVRNGATIQLYINGVADNSYNVGTNTFFTPTQVTSVGSRPAGDRPFKGYISNVRLIIGTAVYTSAFTAPTSKLTAVTNTKLLTCQSNRFVDNSATGLAVSITGNPAVTAFGPFLTSAVYDAAVNGASAYFNASSAILVASPPSFGPQSWTFECWFYFTGDGTYRVLLAQGPANGTDVSEFYRSSDNKLTFQVATSGANRIIMNTAVNVTSNNEWVHCALTHEYTSSSNSTYKIYQNGILGQTLNHTGGYNWASGAGSGRPIVIGRSEWEGDYNSVPSYVQDSRLVVGSVVYTSNFTPPTAPLTAVTNTKLLLNMADGQAIDSAAQNNLTLVGNANVSTDQAKFGDTSFHVPASGDYLKMPGGTETGNFGTGNFTIEMWLYRTASGADQSIIDSRAAASAVDYQTHITSGNKLRSRYGGIAETSATVPVNEWVHIAIVRNNGTVTQYINGTGGGTYSSTASLTVTSSGLTLGGGANDSGSIAGYVDDIRISKMARYTGNFTAPTEPFADKGQ